MDNALFLLGNHKQISTADQYLFGGFICEGYDSYTARIKK
jgi:hypothetical protein